MDEVSAYGAYSEFRPLTHHDKLILDTALKGFAGSGFMPVAVSTAIINGISYRYFCDAISVTQTPRHYLALVYVDRLIDGEIKLGKIVELVEKK